MNNSYEEKFEQIIIEFNTWLLDKYNKKKPSVISRIKRIDSAYRLLNQYAIDECEFVLNSLEYSRLDERMGKEPNTLIEIKGDYVNGLSSLKSALKDFLLFLEEKKYSENIECYQRPRFIGSLVEFNKYVGPQCRNEVQRFSKKEKKKRNGVCEYCNAANQILQSAHIIERPVIISNILNKYYKISDDYYDVDLTEFFLKFKEAHEPLEENVFFLCKECHNKLDNSLEITQEDIFRKRRLSQSSHFQQKLQEYT